MRESPYMTARPMRPRSALGTMLANLELSFWAWAIDEVEDEEGPAPPSLMLAKRALCSRDKMMSDSP